jgi:V/A-type H+-transporting ATPase subunit K
VRRRVLFALGLTVIAGLLGLLTTVLLDLVLPGDARAATLLVEVDPGVVQWGFFSAALATTASSLAAGYAVASVGSAAVGALAEKPELLGRVLILVGLAEGIAIYGLIISILILNRLP